MIDCLWLVWKRRKIRLNATKQRTVVSYVMTQFRPSSLPRSSTSKMEQKVSWKHHRKKEKHHPKKKSRRDRNTSRRPKVQIGGPRTIANETAGRNLEHCWSSKGKREKKNEVYLPCTWCTKHRRIGAICCRCGKTLGGLPELQERHAHMTIERGSQVVKALSSNKPEEDIDVGHLLNNCNGPWWEIIVERCVRKRFSDPENPCGAKVYFDGCADRWEKMKHTDNQCPNKDTQRTNWNAGTPWCEKNSVKMRRTTSHMGCVKRFIKEDWRSNKLKETLFKWNNIQNITWPKAKPSSSSSSQWNGWWTSSWWDKSRKWKEREIHDCF